jgi:hypothetical protein
MTATILRFPFERVRLTPRMSRDVVRVLPAGSYGETLVVCADQGWLHPDWPSAIADAVAVAAYAGGIPVEIDEGRAS